MAEKLTAQQRKFAEVYAQTKDALEAYRAAYGEEVSNNLSKLPVQHIRKLTNPKVQALIEEIQQGLRAQLVLLAPDALRNIVELANNASSEKVRLEANKEILYGSGLKPPEEVQLKHIGLFGSVSLEDMREWVKKFVEVDLTHKPGNGKPGGESHADN